MNLILKYFYHIYLHLILRFWSNETKIYGFVKTVTYIHTLYTVRELNIVRKVKFKSVFFSSQQLKTQGRIFF